MPLLKIKNEGNVKQIFVASMSISDLATVELTPGAASALRQVKMGTTGDEHLGVGVARGGVSSGALVHIITHGFASGVKVATSAVQAGDRLMIATSGRVNPLNTITPAGYPLVSGEGYALVSGGGVISGLTANGWITSAAIAGGASGLIISGYARMNISGYARMNISGAFVGTAFNTGRVFGRAITSGGSGIGIQMLVTLE